MRKNILTIALISASFAFGGAALAQTVTNSETNATTTTPTPLSQAAKDAKVESKGEYKARKKVADANKELNKAECEVSANGMAEHACKKNARAIAKQEKAEAKMTHENEKKVIRDAK
ncbi:MAG: hypothetical protein H7Y33_04700 [Cytophagales bacterium]|nr:hypothetical protein [Rhizobacter sp.]